MKRLDELDDVDESIVGLSVVQLDVDEYVVSKSAIELEVVGLGEAVVVYETAEDLAVFGSLLDEEGPGLFEGELEGELEGLGEKDDNEVGEPSFAVSGDISCIVVVDKTSALPSAITSSNVFLISSGACIDSSASFVVAFL